MFRPESPFLNLPSNLDPKQALFLDGIRIAAQMTEIAHNRLINNLFALASIKQVRIDNANLNSIEVSSFLDAWAIIDAINRIRDLQHQMPGLKKRQGFKNFMKRTALVADLRNVVQHLNNEIPNLAEAGLPVWGALSWFALTDSIQKKGCSCILLAGRLCSGEFPMVNPAGKTFYSIVDHITLNCKNIEVSISDSVRLVEEMIHSMEESLGQSLTGHPGAGADVLVVTEVQFN